MSAIKDKIAWYEFLVKTNREKGIVDASIERDLEVTKEIRDRLDALEKKAHEHPDKVQPTDWTVVIKGDVPYRVASFVGPNDTERSCDEHTEKQMGSVNIPFQSPLPVEVPPSSTLYTGDTERSCEQPAQEQGGDDKDYDALLKKYQDLMAWYDNHSGTPCEQIRHEHEVADLRARLDDAEKENAELKRQLNSEVKG